MVGIMNMLAGARGDISVSISPPTRSTSSSTQDTNAGNHTAKPVNGFATSYAWGLVSVTGGVASVTAGGATATATLSVTASTQGGDSVVAQFYCDMVIEGATYRATCDVSHNWFIV